MHTNLQTHFITMCNTNKPSLHEIKENIFKALNRYTEVSEKKNKGESQADFCSESTKLSSFAANVSCPKTKNVRVKFCSLCSDKTGARETTHSTRDCPVYRSAEQKLQRLSSVGACTFCGYANHNSKSCNFKFTRTCFQCGGNHMSFLYPSKSKPAGSKIGVSKDKVRSGAVWMKEALQVQIGSQTILPTFTCWVQGIKTRALKDSGCQPHFIRSDIAKRANLKILKSNILLTINGFNEARDHFSDVVEVVLTV
jgi:hypothetical protein